MSVGPVEVMVLGFPGTTFTGALAPALADAVAEGDVRILDLVLLTRTADDVEVVEVADLDDSVLGELGEEAAAFVGLLSDTDLDLVAEGLEVGSSAVVVVFEHAWAARLSSAIRAADGRVLMDERIPAAAVEAAVAAARTEAP